MGEGKGKDMVTEGRGGLIEGRESCLLAHLPLWLLSLKRGSQCHVSETGSEGFVNVDLITEVSLSPQALSPPRNQSSTRVLCIRFSSSVADVKSVHFQMPETSSLIWHLALTQVGKSVEK